MRRTRSRTRPPLAVAIAAALAVSATPAGAEERPIVFSVALGESPLDRCGGGVALTREVEERLRRPVFADEDAADIAFAIAARRADGELDSWRAEIVERDRAGAELGRRDVPLPAADCPRALDTLAVVLAIMIGPARVTTEPPWRAEPSPVPSPAPTRVDRPREPPRPSLRGGAAATPPEPPEPLRWRMSPLAGVVGGTGVLPSAAWAVEAGALVRPPVRRFALIARAAYWPPGRLQAPAQAEVDRVGGAALGCLELYRLGSLAAGSVAFGGCAGADAGVITARSANLTTSSKSSWIVGVLAEARLGYRLALRHGVAVEPYLAPQLSALLRRDRFTYRDAAGRERTLLFPAPASFQAGFGVIVHFL
ncbi:MAG: hypothetical protein KF850_11820 [Labilithrix sp.]|nr:hypothetical protein [Labilithrix sp.]